MGTAELKQRTVRTILSFRGVAVITLAATVMLVFACVSVLLETRHELVRRADIMAANVLLLADQAVQIEVDRYDVRLLNIAVELHNAVVDGQQTAPPSREALFGGPAASSSLGDIMIIDPRGAVIASSRPDLTPQYKLALPTIMATTTESATGLAASTVLLPGSGQPLIALTRHCLPGACGAAAAVVAMLPMSWIQGVFDGLVLGRGGAIALVDSSGTLLARQPVLPGMIGHVTELASNIARVPPFEAAIHLPHSTIEDRCCRMTAGWVGDFPLLVFVSIAKSDILRGWSHLAFVTIFAVVVLSAGMVGLMLLLARQVRRKMKVDRELLRANAQLEELAHTDALTGLSNRRGFDVNLAREWRRCRRAGKPISLLMIDADHFKVYNDQFGHQAGDVVLRALAVSMLGHIRRPGDVAARYGGEEFAIVLPDTDLAAATRIAEAIRAGIEALGIPDPQRGCMTVSIGLSCAAPGNGGAADELLAAADAALYESKATGRNRVTVRQVTPLPAAAQAPA